MYSYELLWLAMHSGTGFSKKDIVDMQKSNADNIKSHYFLRKSLHVRNLPTMFLFLFLPRYHMFWNRTGVFINTACEMSLTGRESVWGFLLILPQQENYNTTSTKIQSSLPDHLN